MCNKDLTIQRHGQQWAQDKERNKDYRIPKRQSKNGQSRDTGNIGHKTTEGRKPKEKHTYQKSISFLI